MISTFTAFIDANVFYGARLRSLVLFLAQSKTFRARWSDAVHEEWIENLLRARPDLQRSDLERTRELMNNAVPDCLVANYEPLIESIHLPDPSDRHVVAAAILTRAHVIVTANLSDFPEVSIAPWRLQAKHPDEFLVELFNLHPQAFMTAVREDFTHYVNPALRYSDYLDSLNKAGVPKLTELLGPLGVLMR